MSKPKIGDPDVIVIPVQRLRHIIDTADTNYDAGYTAALLQLRNRITQDNPKQDAKIKKVLDHIQDLLGRCENCGSWVYALDNSCLTCEKAEKVVKQKTKKQP
jgi:hypothetical protein